MCLFKADEETLEEMRKWDRMPREVGLTLPLEVWQTHLDKALSNLSDLTSDPAVSRRLDKRPPEIPFNLNYPMNFILREISEKHD